MDLSEVGEENPPRILKNRRREALVAGVASWLPERSWRRKREEEVEGVREAFL
jgi:hypothetical protein